MLCIDDKIKADVKNVIEYSQHIEDVIVDNLLDNWRNNKEHLYNLFGNKLIYEVGQVNFSLTTDQKEKKLDEFINWIESNYNNSELIDFIDKNREHFYDNYVSDEIRISPKSKIPKGMKIIKAFKFFEENPNKLNDLQSKASMIIQEDKISGTLCFSIHPLDFLSSSENTYGWHSCHALDGDYRAGNLSYMSDNCTFMAYIKGDEDAVLPDFPEDLPWNNKKWRMLLFATEDNLTVFAGRQYPYVLDSVLENVKSFLEDTIFHSIVENESMYNKAKRRWINGCLDEYKKYGLPETYNIGEMIIYNGGCYAITDVIKDYPGPRLHYNDLLYSSCYKPKYIEAKYVWPTIIDGRIKPLVVGNKCNCVKCGDGLIQNSATFMCDDCEIQYGECSGDYYTYCSCCDRRFVSEDGYWVSGEEEVVCPNCFTHECFVCDNCGEVFYNSDKHYDEERDKYFCSRCI